MTPRYRIAMALVMHALMVGIFLLFFCINVSRGSFGIASINGAGMLMNLAVTCIAWITAHDIEAEE